MLSPSTMHALDGTREVSQEGEEGEEDDSDVSGAEERITDVSELARMASRGEPSLHRASPVAAVSASIDPRRAVAERVVLLKRLVTIGCAFTASLPVRSSPVCMPAFQSERVVRTHASDDGCAISYQIPVHASSGILRHDPFVASTAGADDRGTGGSPRTGRIRS